MSAPEPAFVDREGRPLYPDARVAAVSVCPGVPGYVHDGTVTGFGRTRVYVRWDDIAYAQALDSSLLARRAHAVPTRGSGPRVCDAVRVREVPA